MIQIFMKRKKDLNCYKKNTEHSLARTNNK